MTSLIQTIFKIYTGDGHYVVETCPDCLECEEAPVRIRWYEIGADDPDAEMILDHDVLADLSKILTYFTKKDGPQ